jgi:UDP-N-acetylglucosamine--dolichyl-phosphate N-acetylglucosaminephosphotransferase
MARFNPTTGLLEPSRFSVAGTGALGLLVVRVLVALRLARLYPVRPASSATGPAAAWSEHKDAAQVSNLTLINLVLVWCGPLHERTVTVAILAVQVLGTGVAFAIRYPLAALVYDA